MKLIVQLPALNEARTIEQVIRDIPRTLPGIDEIGIVVIDDGSSDETAALASKAGATVIRHARTRGVGAAFRSGVEWALDAGADILVTMDSDGQFNPKDIGCLIAPIQGGEADFVTASRFLDSQMTPAMDRGRMWGNRLIASWISAITGQTFRDVSCGYRAFSRHALLRLVLLEEFTYTHETFLNLAFARLRIREIPVRVRGTREHGRSRVARNLFVYGWRAAKIILKTYRDYRPLRFFGGISAVLFTGAMWLGAFLLSVRVQTGAFTPHKWAGFCAAFLGGCALVLFLVGTVAAMLDRLRATQEELLFRVRRIEQKMKAGTRGAGGD